MSPLNSCLAFFLIGIGSVALEAKTLQETLVFSAGSVSPDGFPQPGILINGSVSPGPPLILEKGDSLELLVINDLPSAFALHMHGLFQQGTQRSDGVPFLTQNPIQPNASYLYTTHAANQTGTYMYHAHTGLDLAFAYGALIIKDGDEVSQNPIYNYDEEIILICNQYWHVSTQSILDGLEGSPFEDVPDTASLLINGRSYGVWNTTEANSFQPQLISTQYAESNSTQDDAEEGLYTVIRVTQGKKYRLRVIGLGVDSMIRLSIDNHTELSVIEVDGALTDPVTTDHLDLNAAQRSSVIVEMNQPVGNYWIVSELYPGPGPRNGRAILHYEGANDPTSMRTLEFPGETEEIELDTWILDELHPSTSVNDGGYGVPKEIDREIVIRSFQVNLPDGRTKFDVNGALIRPHDIGPTLIDLPEADLLANASYYGIYEVLLGERVQMIFENTMSDDEECEQHPWHLHGHNFHVVASGPDAYDSEDTTLIDQIVSNRSEFIVRDVVTLFPHQLVENTTSQAPCGWTAIRFIANNPGLWLVHCHLTPHQIMGKHFILYAH